LSVAAGFVAINGGADSTLQILDTQSGDVIANGARRGQGPGEALIVWSLQLSKEPDGRVSLAAYDFKSMRLSTFDVVGSHLQYRTARQLAIAGAPQNVLRLKDSTLAVAGAFADARWYLIDVDGIAVPKSNVPWLDKGMPAFAAQQALQPALAVKPSGDFIALGARYAGRLDIFRVRDGTQLSAKCPVPFDPEFRFVYRGSTPVFRQGSDTRFGYLSVTATDSEILALFSGRTRRSYPRRADYGDQLHIYDWHGRLLGVRQLAQEVYAIAVDPQGTRLYGLAERPEAAVIYFAAPQLASPEKR
jgi:hypothetical protein